ncbi:MAG: hypothetical protein ACM3IJ_00575 [Candidatus Levyibacteriota bacterium]
MFIVFIICVSALLVISFLLALGSLWSELAKPKELKKIKEKLAREKVLFKK